MGIGWLLWLPFEDSSVGSVLVLSLSTCLLAAWRVLISPFSCKFDLQKAGRERDQFSRTRSYLFYVLLGSLVGVGVTLVSLLVMVLKIGFHGHTTPDFTIEQFVAVVQLTPIWILSGILVSLGLAIWLSNER